MSTHSRAAYLYTGTVCLRYYVPRTRVYPFAFGSRVTSRGSPAQMESFLAEIHPSMPKERLGNRQKGDTRNYTAEDVNCRQRENGRIS